MQNSNPDLCEICGKPRATERARTDVTQYLFSESRCQCELPEDAVRREQATSQREARVLEKERAAEINLIVGETNSGLQSAKSVQASDSKLDFVRANLPERYELIGLFGQGGMGAVVKAFDREENRAVAIKMIRPQLLNDADALKRFEHEAKVAKKLSHPNIATVYDYGVGEAGAPYLVMELVEGASLAAILAKERTFKPKRAVDITLQVAKALSAAHERNVLHRDIKPSNIIVKSVDGVDVVKLVDFGIAKSFVPTADLAQSITQTGQIIGSPAYMSPEQCEGGFIDLRSDIYSLGCVLYEMLCGQTPFESPNPLKVLLQHIEQQPAPVCTKVKEHISDDLNYIVMNCLDKNPKNRYFSAKRLILDLEARKSGKRIVRAHGLDYSPVHIIKEFNSETGVQFQTVAYSKKGWAPIQSTYDTSKALAIALLFVMPVFIVWVAACALHSVIAKTVVLEQMPPPEISYDVMTDQQLLSDPDSFRKAVLLYSANAHRDLAHKKYEKAATNFSRLAGLFLANNEPRFAADNTYFLAYCQSALGDYSSARAQYRKADSLYRAAKVTGPGYLQSRIAGEAAAIVTQPQSAKDDTNTTTGVSK